MKRIAALMLCMLMLLGALPGVAHGEFDYELRQTIIESCVYGEKADLSAYKITAEKLNNLFYELQDSGELPWYIQREGYTYEYDQNTQLVISFEPQVLPEQEYDRAFYQQRLEEILRECVFEWMEPWQIALAVHDYLAVYGDYDETLNITTGYDLLKTGQTVCSGYTEVYRELMKMAGIPCVSVVSEKMAHTWNLVQLDGKWYHVDVTWDDPVPSIQGRARHDYFLLTDEEISGGDKPHYGWRRDILCFDTSYTNAFWRDVNSPIVFTDKNTCYLIRDKELSNTLYKRTLSDRKETAIYEEKNEHITLNGGNYRYPHTGLSLWDGRLWVGSMTTVRSMDLQGKDVRTEFTYDAQTHKKYLAGTYVYQDTLHYTTMEHEGNPESHQEQLTSTGYHIHEYTLTVVEPTSTKPGYTISECSCGIRCESTPTRALSHRTQQNTTYSVGMQSTTQVQSATQWVWDNKKLLGIAAGVLALLLIVTKSTKRKK